MALRGEALHLAQPISEIQHKTEATCLIEFLQALLQTTDISAVLLHNLQSLYTRVGRVA